jgi:hypothetical protein
VGLQDVKTLAMGLTGLDKDALHVYVGLAVFFGSSLVFRWPLGDLRPLAVAAGVALLGEAWDLVDNLRAGAPMLWAGHRHDIWNTLFWPTAIVLLARFTPLVKRG